MVFLAGACGSKTGLKIPDAGARDDGGICARTRLPLVRRTPEILFVIDRSRSMEFDLSGEPAPAGATRRWDLLGDALVRALRDRESSLGFGVLLYPDAPSMINRIEDACRVDARIDVPIAPANVSRLESLFATEVPGGGTPTALALRRARALLGSARPGVQRFVVLATDGAPNCNPAPPIPPPLCLCTSDDRAVCDDPEVGPYQCLDGMDAIAAVEGLSMEDGIPVYVIGIDDPRRLAFRDTLDAMAIAGTRPRPPGGGRFYDVQRPEDLDDALETITASIARCAFYAPRSLALNEIDELRTSDGTALTRDETRSGGWDVTNPVAGEVTLFGATCLAVSDADETLTLFTACR